MIGTLKTQTNVNSTIKQGFPKLMTWLAKIKSLESSSLETAENHHQMFEWALDAAKEMSRIKNKGEKRDRSPLPSPEKKKPKIFKEGKNRDKASRKTKDATSTVTTGVQKTTLAMDTARNEEKKKKKKKTKKEPKKKEVSKNIVVKLEQGQTYASVLGRIRKESNPRTCNATVLGAMPTKKGDVLIRLDKKSDNEAFCTVLRRICHGLGTVQETGKRPVTMEIRDLDSLTEKSEVVEALNEKLGENEVRKVHLLEPNKRNLKLAIVTTTEEEATKFEQMGHICVGFVSCRIRRRIQVLRCYRCLGYGHRSYDCKAGNRSNACYKCGEVGHKKRDCTQKVQCFLCENRKEHMAGSATCGSFREALRLERKKAEKKDYG